MHLHNSCNNGIAVVQRKGKDMREKMVVRKGYIIKKHWIRLFGEEEPLSWFNRRGEFHTVELCKGR